MTELKFVFECFWFIAKNISTSVCHIFCESDSFGELLASSWIGLEFNL